MKVLNFGSLNIDYVYKVKHIVQPSETISSETMEMFAGGKGLNQSIALSRAGIRVYHAGLVGENAGFLLNTLQQDKVDISLIQHIQDKQCGHAIIQIDEQGQNCILLFGGANREVTDSYIENVLCNFKEDDIIILQNEINYLDKIIDKAYAKQMKIVLNPSPFNGSIEKCDLSKVWLFFINEIEGMQISGYDDPQDILNFFLKKYPKSIVVLTLGEKGALCLKDGKIYSQPAIQTQVVDTTAAGDTFTGYFISELINDKDIEQCLLFASYASAITVSKDGASASIPCAEDVRSRLNTLIKNR